MITVFEDFSQKQVKDCVDALTRVWYCEKKTFTIHTGIGSADEEFDSISGSYKKAIAALRVAVKNKKTCLHYHDMGIYRLFVSIEDSNVLKDMNNESLGQLAGFDRENGTNYMDTLQCYLEHDSSVQEVAEITGVHRNTINYKIKKIREILQCEMTHEYKLKIMLAFYIRDYI